MNRSDSNKFSAFNWCKRRGSGWYLPSKRELENLANEYDYRTGRSYINAINETLEEMDYPTISGTYWSSTEDDSRDAFAVDMSDGESFYSNKNNSYCIRAMYIIRNDSRDTITDVTEIAIPAEVIECNVYCEEDYYEEGYYEEDYYEDDYEEVVNIGSER